VRERENLDYEVPPSMARLLQPFRKSKVFDGVFSGYREERCKDLYVSCGESGPSYFREKDLLLPETASIAFELT
jgi:hypothetical protein